MSSWEIMKIAGTSKRVTSQDPIATAEGGAEEINRVEENSDLKPSVMSTEAAEPGGRSVEITHTHNSENQDELLCVTISLLAPRDDLSQRKGGAGALDDPRIAKHLEEKATIKPTVSLSCEECTHRTNDYHGRWQREECVIIGASSTTWTQTTIP